MTKNKLSDKYNESCIRIFELLSLMSKGEVPFSDVIKLFANDEGGLSQISNVILNKYMNTLKVYGVKYKKTRNKYYVHHMPFSISLKEDDLYIVSLIKSAMSYLPSGKTKSDLAEFITELENRYDFDTKHLSTLVASARNYDLSFFFSKFKKQVADCERYCNDGYNLDIFYVDYNERPCNIIASPQELKYEGKDIFLSVYVPSSLQTIDIPLNNIKSINQLAEKYDNEKKKVFTTVSFKLIGDLAKSYKLRNWEKISEVDDNGNITVTNIGEDMQHLFVRLFKYGKSCEIISPKYLRKKMIKLVSKTLKNYEQ